MTFKRAMLVAFRPAGLMSLNHLLHRRGSS